jgi:hypothetical protein
MKSVSDVLTFLFCLGRRGDEGILAEERIGDGHNVVREKKKNKKNKMGFHDGDKVQGQSLTT